MGDWAYGLVIVICAVAWIHIFVDYRKKLMRVMPGIEETTSRKQEVNDRISVAESNSENIARTMAGLNQEIAELEERRMDLQQQLNAKEMVHIPAGRFYMGSNIESYGEENPERRITLKGYFIDKFEVTNIHYKDFIDATDRRAPVHWRNGTFPEGRVAHHPVTNVSWHDVKAYAEWVGKRLPTEAEWERAARGDERREYPWGKASSLDFANFGNPQGNTTPCDNYPGGVSPFGVWDMCGNVGEWVEDWYDPKYYTRSPDTDPTGPEEGSLKVYRGGGYHGNRIDIRAAQRHSALPAMYQQYIGFRCAMDEVE